MDALLIPLVALAPALLFLAALRWLDSGKLTPLRTVLAVVLAGAACALLAGLVNAALRHLLALDGLRYARWVAPFLEESLKALVVVGLLRLRRIGFLVDAALLGFAAGLGFALAGSAGYMLAAPHAPLATAVVRSLGTGLMQGALTALFAMLLLEVQVTLERLRGLAIAGCLGVAIALHAAFDQFWLSPMASALAGVLVLPALLWGVFRAGQRRLARWLGTGPGAEAQLLALLASGAGGDSRPGRYLQALRSRFAPPVAAELFAYLRLAAELSLRAQRLQAARGGAAALPDDDARARLQALDALARRTGRAGLLALQPLLPMGRRALWRSNRPGAAGPASVTPATP